MSYFKVKPFLGIILGFVLISGSVPVISFSETKEFSDSAKITTSSDTSEIQEFSDGVDTILSSETSTNPKADPVESKRKLKFDNGFYDQIQEKIKIKKDFYQCLDEIGGFSNDEIFVFDSNSTIYEDNKTVNVYEKIKDKPKCQKLLVAEESAEDKTIGRLIDKADYHTVMIFVNRDIEFGSNESRSHNNKNQIESNLLQFHNAKDVFKAKRLSFVSAKIPIENITTIADYDNAFFIGNAESKLDLLLNNSKQVIKSTSVSFTGTGVPVAIIDSGISPHQDMPIPGTIINQIVCGSVQCPAISADYSDPLDHGTHVAGIIAGKGIGVSNNSGVATNAQILNIKINTSTDFSAVTIGKGIDWAIDNGARIINLSVGDDEPPFEFIVDLVADEGVDLGTIIIAAGGNSGEIYPNSIADPASGFNVIAVGNLDDHDQLNPTLYTIRDSSSRGPTEDGRLKPDLVAPGTLIRSPSKTPLNGYTDKTGTSFAAPHVSGAAALLLEAHPDYRSLETKGALFLGANWKGDTTYTSTFYDLGISTITPNEQGFGLIDIQKSLDYADDGNKIIKDVIIQSQTKSYGLSVTNGQPTKIFLSWLKHPTGTLPLPDDVPVSNLQLNVKNSAGTILYQGISSIQNNEFAIFTPTQTSNNWKVEVVSNTNIYPEEQFVIASTSPLTPLQTVQCFPDDLTPYDWIITQDCTLAKNTIGLQGNVIVQNGATLTIPSGKILDIDFANKHLLVKFGSKVIVQNGGRIS